MGLASGGGDGSTRLWDVSSGKEVARYSQGIDAPYYGSGRPSPIVTVAVSGDGKWLATMSWDDTAILCPVPAVLRK